jgi:hypothetical protein
MTLSVEDLEEQSKFRPILTVSYTDLVPFIFEYLKRISKVTIFFWSFCLILFIAAIKIRLGIAGNFTLSAIFLHSFLGFILFPVLIIPIHEFLHIFPLWISGVRNIRVGVDFKQYLFYVTAHRHVISPGRFIITAITPFVLITLISLSILHFQPGLWKWSISSFLFAHTTMCAGDFALMNFYYLNKPKRIYTWDDADGKIAYFYEEL